MPIKSIKILGFRGFGTPQDLNFAIPNGKPGSGITAIVGANNGGKSTIVEAIRTFSQQKPPSFTVGKRNQKADNKVSIILCDELGNTKELRTVESGGSETTWINNDGSVKQDGIFVLPSRRFFKPLFSKFVFDRETYISNIELPSIRSSSIEQFSFRLFQIQKDRENRDKFDKVLERVISPVSNWTIDQSEDGQYFLRINVGDTYHNSDGLGEGLVSLFFIVDALYDSNPGDIIAIDEPELSLHPSLQKKLAALLIDYAKDRQIIYATHSPYFIDFEIIANGAKIARVYSKNYNSIISQLSEESVIKLSCFLKNRNNPHILGLDAREVFFLEDGVILVEGQEDVIYYKEIAKQLGTQLKGSFYGWGVGGATNMETIAGMLKDLGFEKVVGLLDNNVAQTLINNLENKFSTPKFHFYKIPADDVRTKNEVKPRPEIQGLVDKEGDLKEEYIDEMNNLFNEINVHFTLLQNS